MAHSRAKPRSIAHDVFDILGEMEVITSSTVHKRLPHYTLNQVSAALSNFARRGILAKIGKEKAEGGRRVYLYQLTTKEDPGGWIASNAGHRKPNRTSKSKGAQHSPAGPASPNFSTRISSLAERLFALACEVEDLHLEMANDIEIAREYARRKRASKRGPQR